MYLFIIFHQISFSNDKWIFDPLTSNLIRLFPTQFWIESATLIGLLLIFHGLLFYNDQMPLPSFYSLNIVVKYHITG